MSRYEGGWAYYRINPRPPSFHALVDRHGVRYPTRVEPRILEDGCVEYVDVESSGVETPDVEKGPHSPPVPPFDLSTAIAPTPVSPTQTGSTPMERLQADGLIPWQHSNPTFSFTDDDGDGLEVHNVFPEQEQGAQVWLTATGGDGQRVQVALDAESLVELGQHLVHQGEDLFNASSTAWLAAGDE